MNPQKLRLFKGNLSLTGFTLLELIVVIVIIAILAVISFPQFTKMKENSLDQEAIANLKLIQTAEKIYKLETTFYNPCENVYGINEGLKLSIPTAETRNWNYEVEVTGTAPDDTFTGKAQRKGSDSRVKCIDQDDDVPCDGAACTPTCTW